ncbi:hypothetical protein V757_03160 [Pelistega indica]|uniref:Uncharacterized protein n=1 Tax=Pelistega indica TaxID=1414851 RepID=V8G9P1_9BURK|nr:hypothetical protein V757_03160 [Pelistega indica]
MEDKELLKVVRIQAGMGQASDRKKRKGNQWGVVNNM